MAAKAGWPISSEGNRPWKLVVERQPCSLICYVFQVRGDASVQELAKKISDPTLREAAMTIAEQLRQEGIELGLEQGRRATVLKQLQLKFGALDEATRARIAAADAPTLDRYTERVLSAATLSAVLDN